jgi:hypothetical protein
LYATITGTAFSAAASATTFAAAACTCAGVPEVIQVAIGLLAMRNAFARSCPDNCGALEAALPNQSTYNLLLGVSTSLAANAGDDAPANAAMLASAAIPSLRLVG